MNRNEIRSLLEENFNMKSMQEKDFLSAFLEKVFIASRPRQVQSLKQSVDEKIYDDLNTQKSVNLLLNKESNIIQEGLTNLDSTQSNYYFPLDDFSKTLKTKYESKTTGLNSLYSDINFLLKQNHNRNDFFKILKMESKDLATLKRSDEHPGTSGVTLMTAAIFPIVSFLMSSDHSEDEPAQLPIKEEKEATPGNIPKRKENVVEELEDEKNPVAPVLETKPLPKKKIKESVSNDEKPRVNKKETEDLNSKENESIPQVRKQQTKDFVFEKKEHELEILNQKSFDDGSEPKTKVADFDFKAPSFDMAKIKETEKKTEFEKTGIPFALDYKKDDLKIVLEKPKEKKKTVAIVGEAGPELIVKTKEFRQDKNISFLRQQVKEELVMNNFSQGSDYENIDFRKVLNDSLKSSNKKVYKR